MKAAVLLAMRLRPLAQQALAQAVGLAGMLGGKALLIVDGAPPKAVAVGDTYKAVKVVSTQGDVAVLEIGGKRLSLRVGGGGGRQRLSEPTMKLQRSRHDRLVLRAVVVEQCRRGHRHLVSGGGRHRRGPGERGSGSPAELGTDASYMARYSVDQLR